MPSSWRISAAAAIMAVAHQRHAVAELAEEVNRGRQLLLERDDELRRQAERAVLLQRMLGADKAAGVLSRALSSAALAALHRWRRFVTELRAAAVDGAALQSAELLGRLRAADTLVTEMAARLEAEEARRSEAERIAFDEGRRRRRADEARASAVAQLEQRALELAAAERLGRDSESTAKERFAETLAARHGERAVSRALATWRTLARSSVRDAARLAAASDAAAQRAESDASARTACDAVREQLAAAQRQASEAQLLVLSLRQQRAEALARAAADEQHKLEAVAREEVGHAKPDAAIDALSVALTVA